MIDPEQDVNLAEELEKPLEKSKKRKVTELEGEEDEEQQNILQGTLTEETKHKIYSVLTDITKEELSANEKMLDIIHKIANFTEEQARVYLEMLIFARSYKMNLNLAKRGLHILANKFIHPNDPNSKEDLQKDEHMLSSLTNALGFLFAKMGNISGLVIFFTYVFYSHYVYGKPKAITNTPIQNDGECPEPNGQNNPDGETYANRMGQ
jgi:hypothetical protein